MNNPCDQGLEMLDLMVQRFNCCTKGFELGSVRGSLGANWTKGLGTGCPSSLKIDTVPWSSVRSPMRVFITNNVFSTVASVSPKSAKQQPALSPT
ncbi:hypothetical protein ACA910_000294 [Epithemia clementina (nom. ined.)]